MRPPGRVGLIGIGNMGWPMAARVLGAGFPLVVADTDAARLARFRAEVGGEAAPSPRALAAECAVIITMLPTSAVVTQVIATGEAAVLAALRPGTVVIEMSSGQPAVTQGLAGRVAELGGSMIDAPVSGGVARAVDGTLTLMVGGEEATVEQVRPVLEAMGNVVRTGQVGSGQAMKALNNLVSAGGFLIGMEALLIGRRFGLDPATMVAVLNASTGMNNSTQNKFRQQVISRAFASGFSLDLMVKDISTALELARETATPAPYAALCRELWAAGQTVLGPGQDHTAMARLCEQLAGTELGD